MHESELYKSIKDAAYDPSNVHAIVKRYLTTNNQAQLDATKQFERLLFETKTEFGIAHKIIVFKIMVSILKERNGNLGYVKHFSQRIRNFIKNQANTIKGDPILTQSFNEVYQELRNSNVYSDSFFKTLAQSAIPILQSYRKSQQAPLKYSRTFLMGLRSVSRFQGTSLLYQEFCNGDKIKKLIEEHAQQASALQSLNYQEGKTRAKDLLNLVKNTLKMQINCINNTRKGVKEIIANFKLQAGSIALTQQDLEVHQMQD